MKKWLFVLLLTSPAYATAQSGLDVLHYHYTIELNDAHDTIYGKAGISFITHQPSGEFVFDLTSADKGKKGMYVTKATLLPSPSAQRDIEISSFSLFSDKLTIKSTDKFRAGDTVSAIIEYKGVPSDGLIISKNKYGKRTFFADNWPNRGHNWIPCHDDPADKATVEFIVTAPAQYQVVANGLQIEETNLPGHKKVTHWKEDVPVSTKVMVIGVADFAVQLSGFINGCIPVYSWVYPEDRDKGFYDYALATEILPFFIHYVGPYGYKKLANVESKTIFGGLENANTIFYSENSIDGQRNSEDLLAHEIAHQWFGNMATEKSFAHLWLSEGFATYMTVLYMENKYGVDKATDLLKEDREQTISYGKRSRKPVINDTSNYLALLNPYSYQKGGWVLHMLRRQLGDSVFHQAIRSYYATYAGKTADSDDLRNIFETVSGKDLKQFFTQWLTYTENPQLEMNWNYDSEKKEVTLTVKQKQKNVFSFPLDMAIINKTGAAVTQKFMINKRESSFTFSFPEKPSTLTADPFTSLLFEGKITELK